MIKIAKTTTEEIFIKNDRLR